MKEGHALLAVLLMCDVLLFIDNAHSQVPDAKTKANPSVAVARDVGDALHPFRPFLIVDKAGFMAHPHD